MGQRLFAHFQVPSEYKVMLGYQCPIQELESIQVQITICLAPGSRKGLFFFFCIFSPLQKSVGKIFQEFSINAPEVIIDQ